MEPNGHHVAVKVDPRSPARRVYDGLGVFLWVVSLAAIVAYCALDWVHKRPIAGLISEHWPLITVIILVVLLIAGQLGASLGIPGLFRDAPPPRGGWGTVVGHSGPLGALLHSGAFLGAFGATLLIAQVWTSIYFADLVYHPEHATFGTAFRDHSDLVRFLVATCPPFLVLVVLAALFPAPAPGIERRGLAFAVEVFRYALGIVVGVLAAWTLIAAGSWVHVHVVGSSDLAGVYTRVGGILRVSQTFAPGDEKDAALLMASYTMFVLVTWAYLLFLGEGLRDWLSPGLAICLLFGYAVILYSMLVSLKAAYQLPAMALGALWLVLANDGAYKYRFPGLDAYRRRRVKLSEFNPATVPAGLTPLEDLDALEAWWWFVVRDRLPAEARAQAQPLLDGLRAGGSGEERAASRAALEALRRGLGPDFARPKLVLVAVTGAAYRSAFWTTVVLDELGKELPDLPRHIRVMTGASGGMVGAAYAAAMRQAPGAAGTGRVTERLRDESKLDSLTTVVRRLLRRDLPRGFWPAPQALDRGVVLEQQWGTLAVSFDDLAEGERQGWRPSLIVSPMIVESGRRLLFSNLDLADLAATLSSGPGPGGGPPRLYSRSALEFFRLFPDAYAPFRLQTAVRMNATFPYISPAVSLPTDPPQRVVDAGYYDNYGVDLATTWAYLNASWIAENTAGLGLLQIRAYPSEAQRTEIAPPGAAGRPGAAASIFRAIRTAFEWLTTPARGAASAMGWSMSFRNDEEVRALDDLLNRPAGPRRFETFIFENPLGFAMNWFLSDDDIADMERSIGATPPGAASPSGRAAEQAPTDAANLREKQRLRHWWNA